MKSTPRLSGPVLAFGIVCFAIAALVGWYALKEHKHSAADDAAQVEIAAATPAETSSETETNLAEPVAAYDLSQGIPPVIPVSLAALFVQTENDVWNVKPWNDYPHASQKFCGVDFNIEGVIQLESAGSVQGKRSYRKSIVVPLTITNATESEVTVTEIGTNVGCIYLLGATRFSGEAFPGTKIAEVVWHYANGQQRRTPIEYAVHARDWRRSRYESPDHLPHPGAKVVWRADGRSDSDRNARLYRFALANPDPARAVKSIEFATAGANPSLFFIALTLDPLRLGQRPDDSEDLEEVDPPPAGQIQVVVVTPDGLPLETARVRAFFLQKKDGSPKYVNKSLTTDTNGMIVFKFPDTMPERLELSAWGDDAEYGGRKMVWDTTTGDIIPASYTFKLGEGISIGGTVVDESDQPIVGAKLSFHRFWNSNEESNKKGEQADYPNRTVTTDFLGVWQAKGLPPEMLDRIGFNLKHPDFVEFSMNIGDNEAEQAKFRAGTHKIVLKRGLIVRGRVTDESDNPIKDAQVWAGKQYYSGTQDTKTDAKGEFSFRNLKEEAIQFSVLAKGLKPETKSITVKPGMEEIVFKLGKGSVIRGVVRNEAGEAVSGVRLSLEGRMNDGSQAFQFEMKSDKDGRFEWDGAPDEPQKFYVGKEGYEQKRGVTLKVAEENVVTLRKGRKLQGWVVDAETEKPITKFRVGVGRSYGDDRFNADYPGMKDYSNVNGTFTMELNEEQSNGIKGEADDYAEKVEKLPTAEDGVIKITLRLKPSPALRGILVDSQGSPVAGGTVALTKGDSMGGGSIMLRNGRLTTYDQGNKVTTTDASGNFTLQSPPESGGMVVGSASVGFGGAPVEQVRSSGRLMLQGFGRIEGTIKVAGVPTAGQQFSFNLANIGVSYQSDGFAKSDEQGKFTFEKLPAGEGSVVRLIKMTENSWRHSHNTSVAIEPGKTTQVSFGEDGAVIKGRVHLETQPAEGEKLTFDGTLMTKMPPMTEKFSTPEEMQAYYKSPEGKEQMKQMKNYGVTIGADGTFSMDSIPPGEYTFTVTAGKPGEDRWNNKAVANGSTIVTVPENSTPYSPVFVPDIFLKPVQKP